MSIPFFGIDGLPGAGKSTMRRLLAERYHVHVVRPCATRQRRRGEGSEEYIFLNPRKFYWMKRNGFFIPQSVWEFDGNMYGAKKPRYCPAVPAGTELVLGV